MLRPTAAIVTACLLASSTADADNTTFHGTAAGSVASTDNQSGSARNRRAGAFSDIRPGFLLTYNSPRHIHELLTEVSFLYQFFAEKPSVTFRGEWKAFFVIGPRSEASVDTAATRGQLNALRAGDSPAETSTMVLPVGHVDTMQLSGSEHASWQASKGVRLFERTFSRYGTTDDSNITPGVFDDVNTEAFELGGGVGLDRRLRNHNFQVELGGSYLYFDKLDPMMRALGSRRDNQLNPRGVVVWQFDINRQWSSNVDAGLVWVRPITQLFGREFSDPYHMGATRREAVFPTGGLLLAYTDVWGRAQFNARRVVSPNLYVAQNTVNSEANVTFAMPLPFLEKDPRARAPKVVGVGTVGFARTELLDPLTSENQGTFNVARIDLAVAWQPRPGQTLGLRYELTYQNGDSSAEMIVPSYLRNTFYFTFSLRYPEEVQVRVPRRQHQSARADKGDLAPIGAEPVVIDPAELLEEDQRER